MKAKEIRAGDRLHKHYVVLSVDRIRDKGTEYVRAQVRYTDGGGGYRYFFPTEEVPLLHKDG
jgi:hypothetical protein